MNTKRVIFLFCFASIILVSIIIAIKSPLKPETEARAIGRALTAAATLYAVLSRLSIDQLETNWLRMVTLSGVDLDPGAEIPREFISNHRDGSNLLATNLTGNGGWFYDVRTISLRLNLTNSISLNFGKKTVVLPPDFFVVDRSGVQFSLSNNLGPEMTNYLEESRAKAIWILEALRPSGRGRKEDTP
jgi:hypothetical protein